MRTSTASAILAGLLLAGLPAAARAQGGCPDPNRAAAEETELVTRLNTLATGSRLCIQAGNVLGLSPGVYQCTAGGWRKLSDMACGPSPNRQGATNPPAAVTPRGAPTTPGDPAGATRQGSVTPTAPGPRPEPGPARQNAVTPGQRPSLAYPPVAGSLNRGRDGVSAQDGGTGTREPAARPSIASQPPPMQDLGGGDRPVQGACQLLGTC